MTQAEVAFIARHLQLKPAARILDIPCGAGRHSLELARRGFRVTGFDLSEDAVARARATARTEQLALDVLQQNMVSLQVDRQFDGAICMGNSFGYLTHDDTVAFIHSLHKCLQPDARLIIDSGMIAESILVTMKREASYEVGDYVFSITNDYDVAQSRLLTHTVLRHGYEEWRQSFSQCVYTCGELSRLLERLGFAIVGRYADLNDAPFALGQSRLLLVANRR